MFGGAGRDAMTDRTEAIILHNARMRREMGIDPVATSDELTLSALYKKVSLENTELTLRHNVVMAERRLEKAKEDLASAVMAATGLGTDSNGETQKQS